MNVFRMLISVADLAAASGDENWLIFDCRHDLANPDAGAQAYAVGHIPGAQFLHLDRDLSGPMTGKNGRHPLPDPQLLATRLAERGVHNEAQIVAYDDVGGMFAVRLWWLLRWLGHEAVAVLDGGLQAWRAAGHALTTSRPFVEASDFGYRVRPHDVAADYVLGHLHQPDMLLIDARSPERFRGENETLDPVGGHIPGAENRFFKNNLDDSGCFKNPTQLRDEFGTLLGGRDARTIVHSCGSGVTACHNLLAMEIAGLSGSRLYAGSWSEWCSDPARPVER